MIRGTVQTVVYHNPENGYAVLRLNTARVARRQISSG